MPPGTSEVWRFLKTFGNLYHPSHLIVVGPQADVVHPRLVSVVGFAPCVVVKVELIVAENDIGQRGDGGDSLKCNKKVSYGLVRTVGHQMLGAVWVSDSDVSY